MSQKPKQYTLREIADFLAITLKGDGDCIITSISPLDKAQSNQISFLEKPEYRKHLATTNASAVILAEEFANQAQTNILISKNPYLSYAKLTELFTDYPCNDQGIHPTAIIGNNCSIDKSSSIAANSVIGNQVIIGKNVQIAAGCVISDFVTIGDNSKLYPNVTIYHRVKIGANAILHGGCVIGSDGFGMANDKGVWHKIHQLGAVAIGDNVEIGANTTIDRGALDDTIIEDGVKLDNQIQVGHNVHIGAHTAIAGCTGIAGSTKIGRHCMIGGGCGISGHIEIISGTILAARSNIGQSITEPGMYAGVIPAIPHRKWWRILKRMMQLEKLAQEVHELEKKNAN